MDVALRVVDDEVRAPQELDVALVARVLGLVRHAFEQFKGWIADDLISAHRYRHTFRYRGPHRLLGMTLDCLGKLLYTDVKTYLVELLMKQDQMSMSMSIESRVPFLDHELVEFAARLPARLKLNGFTTKRILRDAVRSILPETILTRAKMGFPVPFAGWVGGAWNGVAREVLLDHHTRERGLINPSAVESLLDAHRNRRYRGGDAIWALLNLELWYLTFIDGDGVQTLPVPARFASAPTTETPVPTDTVAASAA